ncbi:MAG: hypothetical protein QW101_07885 [Ignisphaera sp.]|uniref:Uncharacterized protein n=1 Tax=Ignisphaera aggregans TaxID=334771 RepID=A0A832ARX8_9CREN
MNYSQESEETCGWIMRCTICGTTWILEVSFDIRDTKRLYHFCRKCRSNTFHEVLERKEKRSKSETK